MVYRDNIKEFQLVVWDYYNKNRRDLAWRRPDKNGVFDPYKILVSEIMLQQTQVTRVVGKYRLFLEAFPSIEKLANASLGDVLRLWSGLGYNRRAKYLHDSAGAVMTLHNGVVPLEMTGLTALPGVGKNTAAAVLVYAYNQPQVFIETNIRSVYIHHFFNDSERVGDTEILPFVRQSLDPTNPREWYWALMDYGTYLKVNQPNPSRKSKHHILQSQFQGSLRQIRGKIMKELASGPKSEAQLSCNVVDARVPAVLQTLMAERLVTHSRGVYSLG